MGEIIYWKEFDEPKPYSYMVGEKNHKGESTGEYVCEDKKVERFIIMSYLRNTDLVEGEIGVRAELVMKNGERKSFNPTTDSANKWNEDLISQAEEYLKSLPK